MLSDFFIHRPIFATVISIAIVLIGLLAITNMPVEKTPDITPPTVVVSAQYPGANAEVIAETVATPLEEQINGVEDMLYMSSKSSDDGSMELTITFEVGTDIDMATVLVQNRVSMAEPMLSEDVIRYGITTQKQSTNITLVVALISPDQRYDSTYMSNYINIYLKDSLSRVEGVGNVTIFGAKDFSMRIWLNPELLKARNLSIAEVLGAIREQNVQVAAGKIGAPPSEKSQQFEYTIKTLGRLATVEQFEDIIIKTNGNNRLVRLKDVARIELGSQLYSWFAQYNGSPAVVMGVFQRPGANALQVAEEVQKTMKQLSRNFPEGLEYRVAFDPTKFISESIKEVLITLGFAVALVVLVVLIFLGSFRTTVIPAVTIPVSLIGTFAIMYLMGISVNTISMFGLVLAIGIVVDDAIVVVENTMRILDEENLSPKEAASKAMHQITGPVIATTLVLLAVFIPTTLVGGISGKLYSQFAITISTATVFSSINALTLSPALCGLFLKPTARQKRLKIFDIFDKHLMNTRKSYVTFVQGFLRKAVIAMAVFAVLAAAGFWGFNALPSGFLPNEDEGFMMINVELPPGASIHRTQAVTDRINDILANTAGIKEYVTIGGYSLLNGVVSSNTGAYFIMLEPWSERTSFDESVFAIVGQVQGQLFTIDEAMCFAFSPPPIFGLGLTGFEVQVQDRGGAGYEKLQYVGDEIMFASMSDPEVERVNSSFKANVPQLYVDIDRTKVKSLGVPMENVFSTMQATLGSYYINDFNLFGRTYKVMAQADQRFRMDAEDIGKLEVKNAKGMMVPFATFADIKDISGPQTVYHYNLYPATTVSGSAGQGYSTGQAMDYIVNLLEEKLPSSMGYEWSGMSFQEIQAGNKAPIIFFLASIFAFLFLAAQYESWTIPIAIILSIPFAVLGAAAFSWVRLFDNNLYTQIGMVLLIGVVSKTAILLVEFAKSEHESGKDITEAAVEAARLRFRPILMTAFSFILGVVPLVIASGAGAMARQVLGTVVFGGMLIATVLGIFFIPVFYLFVQKLADIGTNSEKQANS